MSNCTKIECQANRIRSGFYKKESKQWKEALDNARQRIAELEKRVKVTGHLIDEVYYAFVGGNHSNESVPRDDIGSQLLIIKEALQPKDKQP